MKTDNLYATHADYPSFTFNAEVAEVFDDMVARSIPGYSVQQYVISEYACRIIAQRPPETCVILDVGSSTGNTLLSIHAMAVQRHLDLSHAIYYALDNSPDMCAVCQKKCSEIVPLWKRVSIDHVDLCQSDEYFQRIHHAHDGDIGVIVLHFVLQFIPLAMREHVLRACWNLLRRGGVLIIGEKVRSNSVYTQEVWEELQYRFKRSNGYSDTQIQSKKQALQDVLMPQNADGFRLLLTSLPHSVVEPYFIHGEFQCYAVSKEYIQ